MVGGKERKRERGEGGSGGERGTWKPRDSKVEFSGRRDSDGPTSGVSLNVSTTHGPTEPVSTTLEGWSRWGLSCGPLGRRLRSGSEPAARRSTSSLLDKDGSGTGV